MLRVAIAIAAALATLGWSAGPSAHSSGSVSGAVTAAVAYSMPLDPPAMVVRRFEPPPQPYAAGHRGVDLATATGAPVRAAGAGRVAYAGTLAGRGLVVIAHADGVRTEYEPVRPAVRVGAVVRGGAVIGFVFGRHGRCAAGRCLHWGARVGGTYIDPLSLLRPLGPVRLLP